MRYKSHDGKKKRIASRSGHVVIVGDEFKEIPEHMEANARALGCISEEIYEQILAGADAKPGENKEAPDANEPVDRPATIELRINEMMDSDNNDYFTARGTPNRKVLDELCGFHVEKDEFETAWEKVSGSKDGNE